MLAVQTSSQAQLSNAATPKPLPNSSTLNVTNAGEVSPVPGTVTVLVSQENATIVAETTTVDIALLEEEEVETTTTSTTTTTPEPETTPMEEPLYDDLTFNATVEMMANIYISVFISLY
jgi:hypothetical protein